MASAREVVARAKRSAARGMVAVAAGIDSLASLHLDPDDMRMLLDLAAKGAECDGATEAWQASNGLTYDHRRTAEAFGPACKRVLILPGRADEEGGDGR